MAHDGNAGGENPLERTAYDFSPALEFHSMAASDSFMMRMADSRCDGGSSLDRFQKACQPR